MFVSKATIRFAHGSIETVIIPKKAMSDNVQRLATRRQHERLPATHRPTVPTRALCPRALGAVCTGASEASGSGNHIVSCSSTTHRRIRVLLGPGVHDILSVESCEQTEVLCISI